MQQHAHPEIMPVWIRSMCERECLIISEIYILSVSRTVEMNEWKEMLRDKCRDDTEIKRSAMVQELKESGN